jgi:predicted nuclease of predicted toxin-antitoxin system
MENVGLKLLLDEHLSRKLVPALEPLFPGTAHVSALDLLHTPDDEIWNSAREGGFVIVSKDDDYQIKSFTRGHPPKVIW